MAFIESQFPRLVAFGTSGALQFSDSVVEVDSGAVVQNSVWSEALRPYDLAHATLSQAQFESVRDFLYAVAQGRKNRFRYPDLTDYLVTQANGRLGATGQSGTFVAAAVGNGTPTYQLAKRYTASGQTKDRAIQKPVTRAGANTIYRNASPVTFGGAPGNCALATSTGIVTFVANDSESVTGHTPGATHVFTTATDMAGLAIGEKVYLTGVTGTAAATLNNLAHTISNKTGAGPFTWTLATSTAGLTASGGTAFEYPQATDALTWAGEFDVPVQCLISTFRWEIVNKNKALGLLYQFESLPMRETREIL
ncbi:MAG TPA: DUF2460 domain-containing protein [Burkholderiales bacterium]|nr:DUF2460 domain-containing protein [Burkholderiales bacterium]